MPINYAALAATAERLIRENGTTATLVTPGAATGDAWAPTGGAATETVVRVVFEEYRDAERDGTLVQMGDRKAMVSTQGLSAAPTVRDRLKVGPDLYEVVNVMQAAPAGDALYYTLQVRG